MGGEYDRSRSEPSFSEEGIDSLQEAGTQVDLDELLTEIDKSMAATSTRSTKQQRLQEAEEAPRSAVDDELPMTMSLQQPHLDFGEMEHHYDGASPGGQPDFTNDNLKGDKPMSRGVLMAGGALVALSLLCGVVGLFMAFSASGKIETLQQSLDALQTRLATMQVSGDPRVGQLQAEQAGLTSRLDELTMKLETAAATPATKGSDSQLADVRKRLDALERKASQTVKSTATTPAATKKTSAKPAGTGDWAVVLVSFPTSAQAESERARLQKAGMSTEVHKSQVDGKTWFRVRVLGYASQDAAKSAIPALETKSGIDGAWVARR